MSIRPNRIMQFSPESWLRARMLPPQSPSADLVALCCVLLTHVTMRDAIKWGIRVQQHRKFPLCCFCEIRCLAIDVKNCWAYFEFFYGNMW